MKIIEAMKQLKDLNVKSLDLTAKVAQHCANLDIETPVYADPKGQVAGWIQSHHDMAKEILRLRTAIQKTNILTPVTIELGGTQVTKTIAEWIHRRRDLASTEQKIWAVLGDRGLKEGVIQSTSGGESRPIKIQRWFDPKERDLKVDAFRSEPSKIDAALEVVNAVTDLQ